MVLFTSSSNRILGFASALFIVWQILALARILPPSSGINQWQSNLIEGENYLYSESPSPRLILVGSSTVHRIKASYIGSQVTNLAMNGGSAQTGIEIILRSHRVPPIVLVELDETLTRKIDPVVIDALFGYCSEPIHRLLPGTRQIYQPAAITVMFSEKLYGHLYYHDYLGRGIHYLLKGKSKKNETSNQASETGSKLLKVNSATAIEDLKKQLIAIQLEGHLHLMKGKTLTAFENDVIDLRQQVDKLRKQGSRVILFRVPGEQTIRDTPAERQSEEVIHRLFPNSTYEWLPPPKRTDWQTTDGVHLNDSEARLYGVYLNTQILNSVTLVK